MFHSSASQPPNPDPHHQKIPLIFGHPRPCIPLLYVTPSSKDRVKVQTRLGMRLNLSVAHHSVLPLFSSLPFSWLGRWGGYALVSV